MKRAEDIPEYGNIAHIDKAHWRELVRDWDELNPAVLGLLVWLRGHGERTQEEVADELQLNADQTELLGVLISTQLRLSTCARDNQLKSKYGAFKKMCRANDIPTPGMDDWQNMGAPCFADYAERVLNNEPPAAPQLPTRPRR